MNKLFAILIMCSLSLPVIAIETQEAETTPSEANLEVLTTEEVKELNKNSEPVILPDTLPRKYKAPVSKKKLAKKFIIAMLCVAGTSIFLYGTLSIYNKLRDGLSGENPVPPEGEKPLDKPSDLSEAVKTFIEKTNWNS